MTVAINTRGGSWLFDRTGPEAPFTPEKLTDEHRLIRRTADEFVEQEVLPANERLESKDWPFVRGLLTRCAELGLLGADVPEAYGGLALDKVSSLIVSESVGRLASWAVTFGGQTGLSITPLLCFGTEDQKRRYLPRLVTGEIVGAYALSETGSGSDALGARCRAVRHPDGSFVLNGEKMWITNGGFADLFTVFAKVQADAAGGPEQFTAFLVERAFGGVTTGNEEHKMGLHGSSTVPLILQDVRVPAENVLGEIGKGHKVAFNVLNYGRFKLGAMCSGGARFVVAEAARYAAERRQFGRPIAEFGAIRHKLAEMSVRLYAVESMLYRVAGLLDSAIDGAAAAETPGDSSAAMLRALEEFAVEASIVKVAGSEMMDYVVDQNVQIHGGNGFVRDYPAERHYRDARVNRIFEGTNEINRLLIPAMIGRKWQHELRTPTGETANVGGVPGTMEAIGRAARGVLSAIGAKYGGGSGEHQEVMTWAADIVIETFACDSVAARAAASGSALHSAAAEIYVSDAAARVAVAARSALAALGPEGRALLSLVQQLATLDPVDTVPLRRQIADAVLAQRRYPLG